MNNDITTTNHETFTHAESAAMAKLVYKRFGRDAKAATTAWNRMMGLDCLDCEFLGLVEQGDSESFFGVMQANNESDDPRRSKEIEMLATMMVGDDGEPNLYFVHPLNEPIRAVFVDPNDALMFARCSYEYWVVEDRQHGVYNSVEPLTDDEDD